MSAKLWFLQNIGDMMEQNRDEFGTGKNSWYNLLFMSTHLFIASKYLEREAILEEMQTIYESENPKKNPDETPIGFVLPSKKKKEGKLEFGLSNSENVEKMRPIRAKNDKLNEEIFILQDFFMFLYGIDPRSEVFEEQYLSQLESLFEQWWEEQMKLRSQALEEANKERTDPPNFNEKGEVPDSQRIDV